MSALKGVNIIDIINEIGIIQSVIIALCIGFLLGMLVVIVGDRIIENNSIKNDLRLLYKKANRMHFMEILDEIKKISGI